MTQSHQQPDANDVLFSGSGAPAVQWQNPVTKQDFPIGTSYEGVITRLDAVQQRNIQDKSKLDVWADGAPKMVALVTIQTNLHDPQREGDDGQRTVWVSGKYLTNAVRDAVRKVGATRLDVGGYLKVTLTGYGTPEAGFRAPRLFEAVYTKPQPGAVDANTALGMGQVPQPVAQVPPVAQLIRPQPDYAQGGALPNLATQQPEAAPTPTPVVAGQMDLSSLPPDARALVEKMYAQQQGSQS